LSHHRIKCRNSIPTDLQFAKTTHPRYTTEECKIANQSVKEIDTEKVFVFETQYKNKDSETNNG
jgi:hypothetical protein